MQTLYTFKRVQSNQCGSLISVNYNLQLTKFKAHEACKLPNSKRNTKATENYYN